MEECRGDLITRLRRRAVALTALTAGPVAVKNHELRTIAGRRERPTWFADWQGLREGALPGLPPGIPQSSLDFIGSYSLVMLPLTIASDQAAAVLPPRLRLAAAPGFPTGRHPLLLTFGLQRNVRQRLQRSLPGMTYLEFIAAMPGVALRDETSGYLGPFTLVTRIYLNELLPALLGRLSGYPKDVAWISTRDDCFRVARAVLDTPIVEGMFEGYGTLGRPADFPRFQALASMLAQPIVGQSLIGDLVYTYFDWNLSQALMQPAHGGLKVLQDTIPGLARGDYRWEGIDKSDLGAFRLHVTWQVTLPFPRSSLKIGGLDPSDAFQTARHCRQPAVTGETNGHGIEQS